MFRLMLFNETDYKKFYKFYDYVPPFYPPGSEVRMGSSLKLVGDKCVLLWNYLWNCTPLFRLSGHTRCFHLFPPSLPDRNQHKGEEEIQSWYGVSLLGSPGCQRYDSFLLVQLPVGPRDRKTLSKILRVRSKSGVFLTPCTLF